MVLKCLLVGSILLNLLLYWWGTSQVKICREVDSMWKDRDLRRRGSLLFLGHLAKNHIAEADVRDLIAKSHRESFEKEGVLVSDDLDFSFQNGLVRDVVPFEYIEK